MNSEQKSELFKKALSQIKKIPQNLKSDRFRAEIIRILKETIPYYDWVGFYLADENENLILHEYLGEPTIHTKIRFGEGICGQSAVSKKTFLVSDVTKESNYLSCSIKVKSEIVVPILKDGKFIGELDIDSHTLNAFDNLDKAFLEEICSEIANKIS